MKLITTKQYLLWVDEEVTTNDINNNPTWLVYNRGGFIQLSNEESKGYFRDKIIAYYPLTKKAKELDLPLLPTPFEIHMDEESKLKSEQIYKDVIRFGMVKEDLPCNKQWIQSIFRMGYEAAKPNRFSLEDMINAFDEGTNCGVGVERISGDYDSYEDIQEAHTFGDSLKENFIKSLSTQQYPKEFIPECEDKIALDGHTVIGKEFKTITNSEGKQELVGTYKY